MKNYNHSPTDNSLSYVILWVLDIFCFHFFVKSSIYPEGICHLKKYFRNEWVKC